MLFLSSFIVGKTPLSPSVVFRRTANITTTTSNGCGSLLHTNPNNTIGRYGVHFAKNQSCCSYVTWSKTNRNELLVVRKQQPKQHSAVVSCSNITATIDPFPSITTTPTLKYRRCNHHYLPTRTFATSSSSNNTNDTNGEYYSSYEYPFATEPPEITRTKASDVQNERFNNRTSNNNIDLTTTTITAGPNDPFDDHGKLSMNEIQDILQAQKQYISTKPIGTTPITATVPSYIPPPIPSSQLTKPQTQITTLENGIRIVSNNLYGQVSTIGIVAEMGSRMESITNKNRGVTNVLEMLTCKSSTSKYSGQEISDIVQDWGGTRFVSAGREQTLVCIDLLRPNVPNAVELLNEVIIHPQFRADEVQDAVASLQYNMEHLPPDLLLGESLQLAAYGSNQQLGQHHVVGGTPEFNAALQSISNTTVASYWQNQLLNNPNGLVIGGVGIDHNRLVDIIRNNTDFASLKQNDTNRALLVPSNYTGGEYRYQLPDPMSITEEDSNSGMSMPITTTIEEQNMVKVAMAFEVGGWLKTSTNTSAKSPAELLLTSTEPNDDLVTVCVLQTLLGGGSSFSAGGPGKGMYSRLYRQILNRYSWAESAEAFTSFHTESGLFGIMGTVVHPSYAIDMVHVIAEHILRLTVEPVSNEELSRARNMLKNNVLTQLESRLVLFEDISRQVLTYGKREEIQYTIDKIRNVSAVDIQNLMLRTVQKNPPTFAAVGIDLTSLPQYNDIKNWFSS